MFSGRPKNLIHGEVTPRPLPKRFPSAAFHPLFFLSLPPFKSSALLLVFLPLPEQLAALGLLSFSMFLQDARPSSKKLLQFQQVSVQHVKRHLWLSCGPAFDSWQLVFSLVLDGHMLVFPKLKRLPAHFCICYIKGTDPLNDTWHQAIIKPLKASTQARIGCVNMRKCPKHPETISKTPTALRDYKTGLMRQLKSLKHSEIMPRYSHCPARISPRYQSQFFEISPKLPAVVVGCSTNKCFHGREDSFALSAGTAPNSHGSKI